MLEQYGGNYIVQRSALAGATGTPYVGYYVFSRPDHLEALIIFRSLCDYTINNQSTAWCLRSVDWTDATDAQRRYQCAPSLNYSLTAPYLYSTASYFTVLRDAVVVSSTAVPLPRICTD